MSESIAPTTPAGTTVTLPNTGTIDGQPVSAGQSIGAVRGPGGKFLPRITTQAPNGEAAGVGTVLPAAPRSAKAKARPLRVKQAAAAKQPERQAAARAKKEILQQAEQTANAITRMLVSAVVIGVGEEARPSPDLEKEIKAPLGRILERLEPETSEALAAYADPVMLITALVAWGVQISRVMAVRQAEEESEADSKVPFRPVKNPAGRLPVEPDDLKVEKMDGGNGHHEDEPAGDPYTPSGESVTPDEINNLMGDPNG